MARSGRPRKGERERRSDHLNIRLTVMERGRLDAEARRLGLPVSAHARQLIAKRRPTKRRHAPKTSHAAITALNRVGNNLNQLAHHANTKGDLAPVASQLDHLLARLEQAIEELLEREA
jgi:hypothetical protein